MAMNPHTTPTPPRRGRGIALTLLATALFVAAGCGSGDDDDADDADAATTDGSTTTITNFEMAPQPSAAPTTTPATTQPPETTVPETTVPETTAPPTAPPTTEAPVPERPTIDELITSGEVLNIAHAGGDQEWPHSTFYAFDQAVAAGADILEMDVMLTADGVLIVQHDDTVDRTTPATGRVDSYTFDEITALDAAYDFAEGCWSCPDQPEEAYIYRVVRTGEVPPPDGADPDDFRIIGFAEAVERYPAHAFDVEIKGEGDAAAAVAAELARLIDEYDLTDHIVVVSFDDATVDTFRGLAPDVHVSPGVATMTAWLFGGEPLDPAYRIVQVPPAFGDLDVITPEFWEAVDAAGVVVWMWPNDAATQENAEFYQEMIDQGVTGIIAGRPTQVP